MFHTTMDTNPIPPAREPSPSLSSEPATIAVPTTPSLDIRPDDQREDDQSESVLREIFAGPDGIYPGTRWLIYLAMAGFIIFLEGAILHFRPHPAPPWWGLVTEFSMMLAAILPAFVMAKIEDRPFGDFGLPARGAFGRNCWIGALWGIAALSVLMLALQITGAFSLGPLDLHGARILKFALYYAVFFLVTGLFEEFLLRGYSQWILARGMHFWPAAALLSFAFGAIHSTNQGEAKTGLVAAGLIGFFFCLTLRRTGNLWWAVGFHMAWDWGESYLYSVPDSGTLLPGHLINSSFHGPDWLTGGSVGPEGSYLIFPVLAALWFVFHRVYPHVKYSDSI